MGFFFEVAHLERLYSSRWMMALTVLFDCSDMDTACIGVCGAQVSDILQGAADGGGDAEGGEDASVMGMGYWEEEAEDTD